MIHSSRPADEGQPRRWLFTSAALALAGLAVVAATTRGRRDPLAGPAEALPPARPRSPVAAPFGASARALATPPVFETEGDDRGTAASAVDPSRWGEREHYEHFLDLARSDGGMEDLAVTVLTGDRPDLEKVAFLRALEATDAELAATWFAWVLRELPDESDSARNASIPAFVVRTLSEEALRDPVARSLLREATWGRGVRMAPALRRRAAAAVAACAEEAELARLASDLAGERDELVRQGVLAALQGNADPDAVARHFGPLEPAHGSGTTERDG